MASIPLNASQPPPWSGPTGLADGRVPIARMLQNPQEQPSNFPFQNAQEQNPNLFPPVCLRTHWDPTQIYKRTVPQSLVATPLDPRPYTKVCLEYVTSQEFEDAPRPDDNVVYPSGGSVYPPTRYRESIDNESFLRRLDRPLGTCERDQYIPPRSGDMYKPNTTVPDRAPPSSRFIEELAFPMACMRDKPYDCVEQVQTAAWMRSARPFNNTTKQDRYAIQRKDLVKPQPTPGPFPTSLVQIS
jgi:hypothetical protein